MYKMDNMGMQEDLAGESQKRKERAVELLNTRVPKVINKTTYLIPSADGSTEYKVRHLDAYSCTCPDFTNRCRESGLYCKHINAIILFNKLQNKVEVEDFNLNGIIDKKECPECSSDKISKQGIRKNKSGGKQKYKCLSCGAYFVLDLTKHLKGNIKMVCLVLDMYYKGNSLRDIQDTLYKNFGLKLHHETVRRWINRFMGRINQYVATLKPQTSDTMHIDEQALHIGKENEWCWNALDSDSRFLLATQITKVRRIKDARGIIQKAKAVISQKPDYVATDKGKFYIRALRREFPTRARDTYVMFHKKGINHLTSKMGNQIIERYHATFRERDKVIRGFKSEETANNYVENWRTYYNFVKPHMALEGLTPSEVAGISIGAERNRWLSLIRLSSKGC